MIFMLHRFRNEELGITGHDPDLLRRALADFRRAGVELLAVPDLLDRLRGMGPPVRGAVAFTLDDGYVDQATVGATAFAEFDCPVTTFVSTGFLDGALWFWWDQIEYVFSQTAAKAVDLSSEKRSLQYRWSDAPSKATAQHALTDRLKREQTADRLRSVQLLAQQCEVDLPASPPARYAPMSWDQLRACERRGMTFGPHTVRHPILSRATDAEARDELSDSWSRLREEADQPVAVFCYPNGQRDDYGDREVRLLQSIGVSAAVTGIPGYASRETLNRSPDAVYHVPRFSWADDLPHIRQYTTGFERAKSIVRGAA